ncbi:MAG: hypothetical protein ACK5Z5_04085 [Neisseriaceae bacterium]
MNYKTLLILGAGASMSLVPNLKENEARLPNGSGLVEEIAGFWAKYKIIFISQWLFNNSSFLHNIGIESESALHGLNLQKIIEGIIDTKQKDLGSIKILCYALSLILNDLKNINNKQSHQIQIISIFEKYLTKRVASRMVRKYTLRKIY